MKNVWFTLFILLLNLPFGYWRSRVRKFSISWVMAIHVPVLLIIGVRVLFHLPYQFVMVPFTVGAFFLGQYFGGKLKSSL